MQTKTIMDPNPKELSELSYNRKFYHRKVCIKALKWASHWRIPTSCYTDINHHSGNTIKHPYTCCSRSGCHICSLPNRNHNKKDARNFQYEYVSNTCTSPDNTVLESS